MWIFILDLALDLGISVADMSMALALVSARPDQAGSNPSPLSI
jgi:hypothetical protein